MIGAVASNHGCHRERTAPLDSDHAFSFTKVRNRNRFALYP